MNPCPTTRAVSRSRRAVTKWIDRAVVSLVYLGAIVSANWLTDRFGEITLLPGITVIAGTFAAGLAIFTRNLSQDAVGRLAVVTLMLLGGVLSWWVASPQIAVASVTAFAVSEALDMTVYTLLRPRSWPRALAVAGVVGSVADTLLFLSIAHLPVTASVLIGQLLVKVGVSLVGAASTAGLTAAAAARRLA